MNELIRAAQFWKSYTNVIKQLRDRCYFVPNVYDLEFSAFQTIYRESLQDPLVWQKLSIVATRDLTKSNTYVPRKLTPVLQVVAELVQVAQRIERDEKNRTKQNQIDNERKCEIQSTSDEKEQKEGPENKISKEDDEKNIKSKNKGGAQTSVVNGTAEDELSNLRFEDCPEIQFVSEEYGNNCMKINDLCVNQCSKDEILVLFCIKENGALGVEPLTQIQKYQKCAKIRKIILIVHNELKPFEPLTSDGKKIIKRWRHNTKYSLECFSLLEKTYDITLCIDAPQLVRCDETRKREVLARMNYKLTQLPTIRLSDPFSLYYDLKQDDMVALAHPNNTVSYASVGISK